jgi:hypothetical protein
MIQFVSKDFSRAPWVSKGVSGSLARSFVASNLLQFLLPGPWKREKYYGKAGEDREDDQCRDGGSRWRLERVRGAYGGFDPREKGIVLGGERVLRLRKDGAKEMKKDDEKRNVRKMK